MLATHASRPTPEFSASPLSRENLAAALLVADRCFPNPTDQAFLRGHWHRVLEGQVTYFCADDQDQLTLLEHFVYQAGSEVVGFGGLYRHDGEVEREWLNWFGVDPAHRGHRYGQKLVEHLGGIAFCRGAKTLVGYTEDAEENAATKRFYEALHFKPAVLYSFRGEYVRLYERNSNEHT